MSAWHLTISWILKGIFYKTNVRSYKLYGYNYWAIESHKIGVMFCRDVKIDVYKVISLVW